MLVLSRNANDAVMIGDDIEITVLAITGNTVKLGFAAPADVPVNRSEIYVKIERKKQAAAHQPD